MIRINEAKGNIVSKNSPLGKFLVKTIEQERSFMDDCCDGAETDRHLWSRRVLSGEITVDSMIQYFKKYYSRDDAEFIKRLESAASMNESSSINEANTKSSVIEESISLLQKAKKSLSSIQKKLFKEKHPELSNVSDAYDLVMKVLANLEGSKVLTESFNEAIRYDVSGTTSTGAGDYNIDAERGISSPAKAIELWFKIEAKHPLNTDISAYKKADAIALITWAYENQDKIAEWHKKYRCPYKLEFMLAAIERQFNNKCKSFRENEYGEMIDPFCIG